MIKVDFVIRRGKCNFRCMMTDGRSAVVTRDRLEDSFSEEAFVMVGDVRKHRDLAPKQRARYKVFESRRDMSSFEPKEELRIIQAAIVKHRDLFGGRIDSDLKEELTHAIFLHLWERNYFAAYDPSKSGYFGFISCAVRRWLIDYVKSSAYKTFVTSTSLQMEVGDDGATYADLIPDSRMTDIQVMEGREILASLRVIAKEFSDITFTGHEETYIDIFDSVFIHRDWDTFLERSNVSDYKLRSSRRALVEYLAPFYKELVA